MLSIVFSRARVQGELLSETFTCAQRTGEPIEEDVEAPYVCWKKSAFGTALAVETSKRRIRPKIPKRAARDEVGASPRWQAPVLGHTILLLTGFCSWAMSGAANEATGLLFPQLLRDFQVNPAQVGLAATSFTLGNACGLVLGGGARMGRRQMVLTGLVVAIGSSLLLLVASRFETLLLARTCLGLAAGLFTIAVPALLAEGLPKTKAEAYLATYPSGWPIGAFVAILTAGNHWRWALGVGPLIASLILLPCLLWLPESPQYLLLKGRRKEAERALKKLGTKEEQIVHADTGSAPTGSPTGAGIPFKRLAATLMCRHVASIIVKMWLPVYLGTHGQVGSAVAAMLLMYLLEALGILVTGRLVAGGGNDVLANGARWSLIAGVVATLGCLFCQGSVLAAGLLGATHLIAQANASNLLMAYATCNCSTAARNQTLSRLNFLSFLSGSASRSFQKPRGPQGPQGPEGPGPLTSQLSQGPRMEANGGQSFPKQPNPSAQDPRVWKLRVGILSAEGAPFIDPMQFHSAYVICSLCGEDPQSDAVELFRTHNVSYTGQASWNIEEDLLDYQPPDGLELSIVCQGSGKPDWLLGSARLQHRQFFPLGCNTRLTLVRGGEGIQGTLWVKILVMEDNGTPVSEGPLQDPSSAQWVGGKVPNAPNAGIVKTNGDGNKLNPGIQVTWGKHWVENRPPVVTAIRSQIVPPPIQCQCRQCLSRCIPILDKESLWLRCGCKRCQPGMVEEALGRPFLVEEDSVFSAF